MSSLSRVAILCGLLLATPASVRSADTPEVKAIKAKLEKLEGSVFGDQDDGHRVWLSLVKAENLDAAITLAAGLPKVIDFEVGREATDARLAAVASNHPGLLTLNAGFAEAVTDKGVASVAKLTKLTHLVLSHNRKVSPGGLARLTGLTALESLSVGGIDLAGRASLLAAFPKLTKLSAYDCAFTDADMAVLAKLPNLTELDLSRNDQVTDAGFAGLKTLAKLQRLTLDNTAIGDAGAANFAGLTAMTALYLTSTQVGDAALAHCAGMTKLQYLVVGSTKVRGPGLRHLAKLTELEGLGLDQLPDFTGEGLEHLAGCPKLTKLQLSWTGINDAGLAKIQAIKQLTFLDLPPYGYSRAPEEFWKDLQPKRLTDAGLKSVSGMANLTAFWVAGGGVTDAGVAHLAALKNLESLGFGVLPNVRGPGLAALAALPKLEGLTLTDTGVTDDGLKALAGLKQIKFLWLPRGSTAAGLVHIAKLQQLETVVVPGAWPAADFEAARKAFPKATVRQQN